jgi:hypothetical protein
MTAMVCDGFPEHEGRLPKEDKAMLLGLYAEYEVLLGRPFGALEGEGVSEELKQLVCQAYALVQDTPGCSPRTRRWLPAAALPRPSATRSSAPKLRYLLATLDACVAASHLTCYSKVPLADAQREIATDWIVADGFEPKSLR